MTKTSRSLHWLDPHTAGGGTTWGVPWPRGALGPGDPLTLVSDGGAVPLQSSVAATWPDGSAKWTTHSAVLPAGGVLALESGPGPTVPGPPGAIAVVEGPETIVVDTGVARWTLGRSGFALFGEATVGGRVLVEGGEGVCLHEARTGEPGQGEEEGTRTVVCHRAEVTSAVVEVAGPLRVVVRQEGVHRSPQGRGGLPFVLRSTFYAGEASVGLVHTLIYDGDPASDFIRGLGLRFTFPLSGDDWNRHVVFAGDTGVVREAARGLAMRRDKLHPELYQRQHAGLGVDVDAVADPAYRALVDDLAVWNDFRLTQDSDCHWALRKRTGAGRCWVEGWHGARARGLVFVGDAEDGGVSVGVRNFWRKHPTALDVSGLATDRGAVTAWLWSPDAPPMDLRLYDHKTHVEGAYEGFAEPRSTPVGVANTGELTLALHPRSPTDDQVSAQAHRLDSPPRLVCSPQDYARAGVFGAWAPVDRSTPARSRVEDGLEALVNFYQGEVDQRRWYGFWNYGDVMHTYDPVRHQWRYDVGGYAWQNTELVPNLWLWLTFLRTGRADVFRLAEAMTRHTSETDVYHLGPYRGLGSRHNVVHWGCGCKEARISMAGLHRVYYYLTGDPRTGELLDEVKDADAATLVVDPMRELFPPDEHPTHVRSGPDWAAFVSNWMTRWERFGDTRYRDKILRGIASLKAAPLGLCSGPTFGYDPADGTLTHLSDENYSYHMVVAFGAPEVWFELADLLDDEDGEGWKDMLAQFGEFYTLDAEALAQRTGGRLRRHDWDWPLFAARMMAYAGRRLGRGDLSRRAWEVLHTNTAFLKLDAMHPVRVDASDVPQGVDEVPWITTNIASQWSLNAIECLALVPGALEEIEP